MERVVKGFMGYSKETNDKPATHVILTVSEYYDIKNDIREAKSETERTVNNAKIEMGDFKKQVNDLIEQERSTSKKRLEALQGDLDNAKVEIHRLNDLNANLLRISREKANAKRGIKPKKLHHGYIVLDSQQYSYTFRWVGRSVITKAFPCWKVHIQSPYDSSIPYDTIVKSIYSDLKKVFGSSLGIHAAYNLSDCNKSEIEELWDGDRNFIFKTSYKSNIRSGFWEIEYFVKSSIIVPEDMRVL